MKSLRIVWLGGLFALLTAGSAFAQVTTGTISGTVKDSSGAVLPGAQVVVLNDDTGISRAIQTDASGRYNAPSLSVGNYRVTASHEGFQTVVHTGIVLTVGREAVMDLSLEVGSVSQSVEVTGEAPLVEATSASLGSLVGDRTIRALPLNGRSYDQLALLQPGVIQTSPGQIGGTPYAFGTGSRFTVGGQRSVSNSFLLDGTNINDQGNGTPGGAAGTNLGVDTIQEFKIFTSSFKAEFGRSTGGIISAVTRSGTNTLHGSAFEYIRNSALDARNFFDTKSAPPPFKRNQFGGVLGGRLIKDRSFFFGGYEGLRQGLSPNLAAIVPTVEARQGNLPSGRVAVNPASVPYLNLYPLPNGRDFGDGTAQFLATPTIPTNEDNVMVRVDHQLDSKTGLFARYTFDTDSVSAQQPIPNVFVKQKTRRQYTTVQANSVLSGTTLNNFRFAFNRTYSAYTPVIDPPVAPELQLIPGQPLGQIGIGAVGNTAASLALTPLGSPSAGSGARLWGYNVFEWADDFSYSSGKNSFKAGVDITRLRDNTASGNRLRGNLTFTSFANFLAGTAGNLQAASPLGVLPQWGLRQTILGFYGQDDYALNSRLTLNLGLRWEAATDPVDANGQISVLPTLSSPAMVVSDSFFQIKKKNFEPRLGLAWRVDESGKTVVRAGGGVYHNQILPWAYALNIINPPFYGTYSAANPPFPNSYTVLRPGAALAISVFDPVVNTPTTYQYNLSIQRQIAKDTILQLAYAGNRSTHLQTQKESDPATPVFSNGDFRTPFFPAGVPRVNPNFAGMTHLQFNGNSLYNSMTVTLRKQSSKGFQGQVFYNYSRAMDINSGVSQSDTVRTPQAVQNPYNIRLDWARADFDATHSAVANFTYALPFKASSKALGALVNGWDLNGIGTLSSGMPLTLRLVSAVSRSQAAFTADRPNLNPGGNNNPISGTSAGCNGFRAGTKVGEPTNWYDPCNFSLQAAGTYGNLGRNTVTTPGVRSVDLALEKTFKMRETASVKFKAEMFNVFNHANFGVPAPNPLAANGAASPSAGIITSTTTASRQIQFALRVDF